MATLEQWSLTTSQLVMDRLPGHDYESARALVDAHLISLGGWVPSDENLPEGEGAPNGGSTETQAADAIETAQLARINTLTITVPVVLEMQIPGNFASGTSESEMVTSLQSSIESRVSGVLSDLNGFSIDSYTWASVSSSNRAGGTLNQSAMQSVDTEVKAGAPFEDPAAIATAHARESLGLNDTWVATSLYLRTTGTLGVTIEKFTANTYSTDDGGVDYHYVVSLDRTTLDVQTVSRVS